jgi:hypothetical protein
MRWPAAWSDPTLLELLKDSAINCLLAPDNLLEVLKPAAAKLSISVVPAKNAPGSVLLAKGVWAGIRMASSHADADAGPTGAPWVDANGWLIQLERARGHAGVWVEAEELPKTVSRWFNLEVPFADAAAHGGRWVIALPDAYAASLAARDQRAVAVWDRLRAATRFFAEHDGWRDYQPVAALGVVSTFSEENEMMGTEILNLTARLHQPFRVIPVDRFQANSLTGLRAAVFADAGEPPAAIKNALVSFAQQGGLVIAGRKWQGVAMTPSPKSGVGDGTLAVYDQFALGKGRFAAPKEEWSDPYLVSSEVKILMGGQSDLVRCWNAGGMNSYLARGSDGRSILHLINYTSHDGRYAPAVRVAGKYAHARIWLIGEKDPKLLTLKPAPGGVEMDLPNFATYAAVELS